MFAPSGWPIQLQRILLPTDFSEASNETLERALVLANRTGAQLRIFHSELAHDPHVARRRDELFARIEELRGRWPSEMATRSDFAFSSAPAISAYDGIMAEVESYRPDLIAMATHGGGLLMGSVAERVVRNAPCGILTCRLHAQGGWPMWRGPILVAVDFSDNAKRALDAARSLADGSPITLVHVVDAARPPTPYRDHVRLPFELDPGLQERVEEHLLEWADGRADAVSAVQGEVRETLLDECRRHAAALVVVGIHGFCSRSHWLLGSTAERLTRACPAPVLVVR